MLAVPLALRRAWLRWRYSPADHVLDRVSTLVKEHVVFDAPEFNGTFVIDPRSHLLRRYLRDGFYEPRISQLFLANIVPERDVLDIGANIGFFSICGAKRLTTGRLLAVEPTSNAFCRLQENVSRNQVADRVLLYKGLVSSSRGQAQIHSIPGLEEYSALTEVEHPATKDQGTISEVVPVETVDALVSRYSLQPAVLKVDVEGAEPLVFSGARHVLETFRPIVISEIWRQSRNGGGAGSVDVIRLFRQLDYLVFDAHDSRAEPGVREIGDILCVPREKHPLNGLVW